MVKMEYQKTPNESDSVLLVERIQLPINVSKWILEETSYVLEGTPFLSHVSGLSCRSDKLSEVTICFFGQRSKRVSNE